MRYITVELGKPPSGNDIVPYDGSIEVSDEIFALHIQHLDWVWNGAAFVPYDEMFPPTPPTLAELKDAKRVEITSKFLSAMTTGVVEYNGIPIDARRSPNHNDLQNMESLHTNMVRKSITEIPFKCADNAFRVLSANDLSEIRFAILDAGEALYKKKHTLELEIDMAETEEDINNINW